MMLEDAKNVKMRWARCAMKRVDVFIIMVKARDGARIAKVKSILTGEEINIHDRVSQSVLAYNGNVQSVSK